MFLSINADLVAHPFKYIYIYVYMDFNKLFLGYIHDQITSHILQWCPWRIHGHAEIILYIHNPFVDDKLPWRYMSYKAVITQMSSSMMSRRDYEYSPLYLRLGEEGHVSKFWVNIPRMNVNMVIVFPGYWLLKKFKKKLSWSQVQGYDHRFIHKWP